METGLILWNREPLVINRELARRLGLHEAIVIQQIHYWCQRNRQRNRNCQDGHYWTYNTYQEWQTQFDFWSLMTVKRIFQRLIKQGYVVSGCYNKEIRDRTRWYRLNPDAFDDFDDSPIAIKEKLVYRKRKQPAETVITKYKFAYEPGLVRPEKEPVHA